MFNRVFLAHPRSVNETYLQHARVAAGFGGQLLLAGCACLVHALVPALFTTTASRRVAALGAKMGVNRRIGGQREDAA